MPAMHPMINVAVRAARAAGRIITRASLDLDAVKVARKQRNDFVTEVDRASEAAIIGTLKQAYPDHAFLGEESGHTQGKVQAPPHEAENVWIIDPLDGTTNFVHGLPCYCISIGLANGSDMLVGVVLEVTRNECFSAWKGGGAWLNGKANLVSQRRRLQESLLATGFPYDDFDKEAAYMELLRALMHNSRGIRRLGSAAADLAYVACGRFEAFYEYGLNPWDVAGGALLVREAGGTVTDFGNGDDWLFGEELLASNGHIHGELIGPIGKFFGK
jgi:myo-inositol-1(or 4)-monophosphatase